MTEGEKFIPPRPSMPESEGSRPVSAFGQAGEALVHMASFTNELIAMCDVEGKLVYLNPAGRQLIGIEEADIFPVRLTDYVVPEQRAMIDAEVIPKARETGAWQGEMQILNLRSGAVMDVQRSTFAMRDLAGEVTGFVSMMRDVTASKAEANRLRGLADTFYGLIANNPFGVYLVDANFSLRVVSRGAQKVFANVRPLIGRNFAEVLRILWPEPFASEAIGHFRHTLVTGEPYEAPGTVEDRADIGEREAYDWRIERVTMPDGGHGVVAYFYDLTEREALTRSLAEREAQLSELAGDLERRVRERTSALNRLNERLSAEIERREASQAALAQSQKLEALGQLTSGIAHDFNNILGAVGGGFTVIENRVDDHRIRQIVKMGQNATARGAALVRQLLAFARQQDLEPQRIDVAASLADIADLIAHGVRGDVLLATETAPDLWAAYADPTQLQSALLNLAVNAGDAMPGGGTLHIIAGNQPFDAPDHPPEMNGRDAVVIRVADTGIGMDGPLLQRVTEPFFTTKAPGQGTGLGLAMVQAFVRQSLGALRIESQVGKGTTFSIYLPTADDRDRKPIDPAAADRDERPQMRSFETILLVDDDPEVRGVIAAGLEDFGFEILLAPDAVAAEAILMARDVDALVTDIDMPGIGGVDLVARTRALRPDLPCLFITGGALPVNIDAETVIPKPFTPATLRAALHQALVERDRRASDAERLDRLALRLKFDCTRSLLGHWRRIRQHAAVPRFERFRLEECSEPHRMVVAQVDLSKVPIQFFFTLVGNTLREAAGADVAADQLPVSGNDTVAAREAAYRRCAMTGQPSYEYARFDLGEGIVEQFERLLLPFSTDGSTVDWIVGAVVIHREQGTGQT
jgi:PAS domain S-box-containing protein